MSNRRKTMLMMFTDYIFNILLQILGWVLFAQIPALSFLNPFYSVLMCLLLFSFLYARAYNTAKRDAKTELKRSKAEGLLLAMPLAVLNLLIILLFTLIQSNIIPIRDVVVKTVYSFPDNAPRVATDILLFDYIVIIIRVWFGSLIGFMKAELSPCLLLVTPLLILGAGFLGYYLGCKKIYISELLSSLKKKLADKFNE